MSALTPGQGESAAGPERDPAAARPHRAHRHSPPRLLPLGEPPPSKAAAASCAGSCRRCLETGRVWARAPHEGLRWQVHKGSWATRRQMPYQRRSSLFKLREASRPTCPRCRAPPAARRRRPQERRVRAARVAAASPLCPRARPASLQDPEAARRRGPRCRGQRARAPAPGGEGQCLSSVSFLASAAWPSIRRRGRKVYLMCLTISSQFRRCLNVNIR